jgi:NTE family protein
MTRTGLVLAGGAAHGAYEVGVLRYLHEELARELGGTPRFDVICGTSVGALNACALAAFADAPATGVARMVAAWEGLRLSEMLRPSPTGIAAMVTALAGRHGSAAAGLFSSRPIADLLQRTVPFEGIGVNVAAGRVGALAVSTTRVASGEVVVFVQQRARLLDAELGGAAVACPARIGVRHVLASAAVPLLFPPVAIDGALHCDGGLRQMLPLAPALRLGADALVVVNPRRFPDVEPAAVRRARERAYGSPVFLVGRVLDVLLVDRVQEDLGRLRQIDAILEAGTRRYGAGFVSELAQQLRAAGRPPVRPVDAVEICSSQDLARVAADYVRSPLFLRRAGQLHGRVFRCLADAEGTRETTFLSYLLFDGELAGRLMEIGRADARARSGELRALLADSMVPRRRRDPPGRSQPP